MKTRAIAVTLIVVILFALVVWYLFPRTKIQAALPTTWKTETFGTLQGITKSPTANPKSVVVLIHAYGSNEEDLADLGSTLLPESAVVSLMAPMQIGPRAYTWFNTDSSKSPPVANSADAMASFDQVQQAVLAASERYHLPLNKFSIMGFSQGAIMTIGLVLAGQNDYGAYVAFCGRTLPEFAKAATEGDPSSFQRRPLLVFHTELAIRNFLLRTPRERKKSLSLSMQITNLNLSKATILFCRKNCRRPKIGSTLNTRI